MDEEGVDLGVGVVGLDHLEEPRLAGVISQVFAEGLDADLLAVLVLEAHVGGARRVVADEDRAKPGRDPRLGERRHLLGQLGAHGRGDGRSVENRRAHPFLLVPEVPFAGEDDGDAVLVGGGDHLFVTE